MSKISLLLITILLIKAFSEGDQDPGANACTGFTPNDETQTCTGEEISLFEKCVYSDGICTPSTKSCDEVHNLEGKEASKTDCEAIQVTNGYCIKTNSGCASVKICGNEDDFEVTTQTTCDGLTVSDNYHNCVLTGNRCMEDDKSCSEFLTDNIVTASICSNLKTTNGYFCILKEEGGGCAQTNICENVKAEANQQICQSLTTNENNNICYFDGESCKEANSCENIINQESTPVTDDLWDLLSTGDYKCIIDSSETNKCKKHFYCGKAEYVSENLCDSYLVKTPGKICKKKPNENACFEDEETTSQDEDNTQDEENSGDDTSKDGENTKDEENTGDDTSKDEDNTEDNTGKEEGTNESDSKSNSKDNSTSNDNAETENGNTLKITFSIFCLILIL